ncbi:hypothetical protein J2129_002483 [Methanofollis sp. W23]|nr:hypothetical protein [Methanofollis sp. W23]
MVGKAEWMANEEASCSPPLYRVAGGAGGGKPSAEMAI